MINGELIVDNFAGGGGASTGIEMATGYSVDIAINHDPEAIRMHKVNHPNTKHYCENVWAVDPVKACEGHPVALAWFSPDCKHFSKAKGGKPKDKNIRGLAWVACRWAALVRPRVIMLENVEEFKTWGPLNRGHHPIRARMVDVFDDPVETKDLCPDCLEELRDFLDGAQLNDPLEERQIGFKTQADPYNHLMKRFTRKE